MRQALTLGHDGRFRHRVETHDFNGDACTATVAKAGRYRLEAHQLMLQLDDSGRESHGLLEPDLSSDSVLLIDGEAYLKRATDPDTTD